VFICSFSGRKGMKNVIPRKFFLLFYVISRKFKTSFYVIPRKFEMPFYVISRKFGMLFISFSVKQPNGFPSNNRMKYRQTTE
jgi:hypothetical protein